MMAAATLRDAACFDIGSTARFAQSQGRGEAKIERARGDLEALLVDANAGDARAFARFLTEVLPLVRKVVHAKGRGLPADQHEDVVQEVLLAIHLKRQTWDPATPLRPWLYAVTRYKVVDAFRRKGRAIHLPVEDFADIIEDDTQVIPHGDGDAHAILAQIDQRSAAIVRAIGIDGERPSDVGVRMSMSEGAVRVAFHRAVRKLAALARGTDR
jgi:RNA polymerase sigma factor (sigma-70 family)